MYNLGIDIGYSHTKTSEGIIFQSKILNGGGFVGDGCEIKIDGTRYLYGYGANDLDLSKADSELTKVCLLAAIILSTNDNEVNVASGLPVAHYKNQKSALYNSIMKCSGSTVEMDGEVRKITIRDCAVYPQGVACMYAYDIDGDCILVDIGGKTVDIAYFTYQNGSRKLSDFSTIYKGIYTLQSKVIDEINKRFPVSLDIEHAEKIMNNGLYIFGDRQDIDFIQELYWMHTREIVKELILKYPYHTTPVYLCGGGADVLLPSFKKEIKNIKALSNGQFANAIGFKKLADAKWAVEKGWCRV